MRASNDPHKSAWTIAKKGPRLKEEPGTRVVVDEALFRASDRGLIVANFGCFLSFLSVFLAGTALDIKTCRKLHSQLPVSFSKERKIRTFRIITAR
jgi:hypothetical protein